MLIDWIILKTEYRGLLSIKPGEVAIDLKNVRKLMLNIKVVADGI